MRERARADRSDGEFCVLSMRLSMFERKDEEQALELLCERTRPYDLVAILRPGEIVALLPDTGERGAWKLADDVREKLASRSIGGHFTVYRYPSQEPEHASERPAEASRTGLEAPASASSTIATRSLAPMFLQPIGLLRRSLDVAISGTALLLLSPVLAVVAAAVKLTSPGLIIYRQQRAGRGGLAFTFYKFRSMYVDAEARQAELRAHNEQDGPIFKMRNDPRMTPIGRLLRRSSIDELPQLWNVFCGDMTLIGPRPPKVEEVHGYEPWQRRRLEAKGGLTCIWQVSGRSEIGFEDWVRMDLRYLDRRSMALDVKLLFKTVLAVASGRGAY